MDDRAIKLWLKLLDHSVVFQKYHLAAVAGNAAAMQKLVTVYPKLGELYADFGDVCVTKPYQSAKAFRTWLAQREALFRQRRAAIVLANPSDAILDTKHALIQIEIIADIGRVKEEINQAIDAIYYRAFHAALFDPNTLATPDLPKYGLPDGEAAVNAATLGSVEKSLYLATLQYKLKSVAGRKITQPDLVLAAKLDSKNPFKWTLSDEEEAEINRHGVSYAFIDSSELTLVKRHLKLSKLYLKNALNGRFPDASQ